MIYLDANATSRLRPAAREELSALIAEEPPLANPSSVHGPGRRGRAAIAAARASLLRLLGFGPAERGTGQVVFTSGGTEACNMLVSGFLGAATALRSAPARIVSSAIEHAAIEEPLKNLERAGWEIVRVAPQSDGIVSVEKFVAAVNEPHSLPTALVCLMGANNETGAVQSIDLVSRSLRQGLNGPKYSGPIVSDMIQALGKTRLNLPQLFEAGVSAVALSGHKIGASAGVGAFVSAGSNHGLCFPFSPILGGGPQESRFRPGTENLFGIVAFGAAARELLPRQELELTQISSLRERLWQRISGELAGAVRLTPEAADYQRTKSYSEQRSLSNTLSLRLPPCRADDLVVALDLAGVAASTGSACASGKQGVSPVLLAAGLRKEQAREVIRLSLDWDVTAEQIEQAASIIIKTVQRMAAEQTGTVLS